LVGVQQILKHALKGAEDTHFGPQKAAKFVITRRVFRAKNIRKCVCRRGSAPVPAGGVYNAPPGPLAGFGEGKRREGEWEEGGKTRGKEGKEWVKGEGARVWRGRERGGSGKGSRRKERTSCAPYLSPWLR